MKDAEPALVLYLNWIKMEIVKLLIISKAAKKEEALALIFSDTKQLVKTALLTDLKDMAKKENAKTVRLIGLMARGKEGVQTPSATKKEKVKKLMCTILEKIVAVILGSM